jgi:hypothetical protein
MNPCQQRCEPNNALQGNMICRDRTGLAMDCVLANAVTIPSQQGTAKPCILAASQ